MSAQDGYLNLTKEKQNKTWNWVVENRGREYWESNLKQGQARNQEQLKLPGIYEGAPS